MADVAGTMRQLAETMRALGITEATFTEGPVACLRLGPEPTRVSDTEPAPRQELDPEEAARRAAADYERTLFASAGG